MKQITPYKSHTQFTGSLYSQDKILFVRYENMNDLIGDCEANSSSGKWTNKLFCYNGTHFTFGFDYPSKEASLRAMRMGLISNKYLDQVEAETSKLLTANPELNDLYRSAAQYRRRRKFVEAGDELDIDKYMGGQVECWQTNPRQIKQNSVRIFIAGGLNAMQDSMKFVTNMIQFAVMCDVFQRMGISVEVNVGKASQMGAPGNQFIVESTLIKEASSPLDISRMMTSGLPAFYRYLSFYLKENLCTKPDTGLGKPIQEMTPELEVVKQFAGYDIILTSQNASNTVSVIHETIKKITV